MTPSFIQRRKINEMQKLKSNEDLINEMIHPKWKNKIYRYILFTNAIDAFQT